MKCAKCKSQMDKIGYMGIEVDRCKSCFGMWFDVNELQDILKLKGGTAVDIGNEWEFKNSSQIEDYSCPEDGFKMIKMVDPKQSHVWYESCGHCKGIFLDATELKKLNERTLVSLFKSITAPERRI